MYSMVLFKLLYKIEAKLLLDFSDLNSPNIQRPNHLPFFESSTQLPGMYFRVKYISLTALTNNNDNEGGSINAPNERSRYRSPFTNQFIRSAYMTPPLMNIGIVM
ncbi:6744_t:CDS:2 [Funneliformis caledonium]|uniref:6744_t:CDS:1 n=1 Tax=Funneliformis caledonium TaxID=1117310 RepID=A0A9N9GFE9_9GLOM|nr:6744_t:CDS:2 [Funneliformis caledonium]